MQLTSLVFRTFLLACLSAVPSYGQAGQPSTAPATLTIAGDKVQPDGKTTAPYSEVFDKVE